MSRIKWDEPMGRHDDTEMPYRRSWLWTGLLGLVFWIALVSLLVGCAPSTAQLDTMSGVELWKAHERSSNGWTGTYDMNIVRALRARGGITDADVEWYASGKKYEHETMFKCWGDFSSVPSLGYAYDWEAMGYDKDEWFAEFTGSLSALGGTNVYTSRGVVNVRSLGGGSFRTQRSGFGR